MESKKTWLGHTVTDKNGMFIGIANSSELAKAVEEAFDYAVTHGKLDKECEK